MTKLSIFLATLMVSSLGYSAEIKEIKSKSGLGTGSWTIKCQDPKTESDRMRLRNNGLGTCGMDHRPTEADIKYCCPSGRANIQRSNSMNAGAKVPASKGPSFQRKY